MLALGDSLTAGYGATPMTNGYAYLLYKDGVYDTMTNTSFADAAVPGATSAQVLDFQVPLALQTGYQPEVIVMTVGGNDLLTILNGADPTKVINAFAANLTGILGQISRRPPNSNIYEPLAKFIERGEFSLCSRGGGAGAQAGAGLSCVTRSI